MPAKIHCTMMVHHDQTVISPTAMSASIHTACFGVRADYCVHIAPETSFVLDSAGPPVELMGRSQREICMRQRSLPEDVGSANIT